MYQFQWDALHEVAVILKAASYSGEIKQDIYDNINNKTIFFE
tara:strand:+ start:39 stop:164 length:126 start_codon:yes stop_codon:yes gene_type:complete